MNTKLLIVKNYTENKPTWDEILAQARVKIAQEALNPTVRLPKLRSSEERKEARKAMFWLFVVLGVCSFLAIGLTIRFHWILSLPFLVYILGILGHLKFLIEDEIEDMQALLAIAKTKFGEKASSPLTKLIDVVVLLLVASLLAMAVSNKVFADYHVLGSSTIDIQPTVSCTKSYKETTKKPIWSDYVTSCLEELTQSVNSCEALNKGEAFKEVCKQHVYNVSVSNYEKTKYIGN